MGTFLIVSVIKIKKNIFLKQLIVMGTNEVKTLFAVMWLQSELEPSSGTPLCCTSSISITEENQLFY